MHFSKEGKPEQTLLTSNEIISKLGSNWVQPDKINILSKTSKKFEGGKCQSKSKLKEKQSHEGKMPWSLAKKVRIKWAIFTMKST